MEHGDAEKITRGDKEKAKTYDIKLRPQVLDYFKERLIERHLREQGEIQREGSFQALTEFNNSVFSQLVNRIIEAGNNEANPTTLNASKADMSLIEEKSGNTSGLSAGSHLLHREMTRDLKDSYSRAELGSKVKTVVEKAKTYLKRK